VNALSLVLAKHVGSVLTVALARKIAFDVSPSQAYPPATWAPVVYGDYTFQCERLANVLPALQGQRLRYLAETRPGQRNDRTDWDRLLEAQRTGSHVIYTARDQRSGDIVGSCWLFVGFDLDSGELAVTDDMLYVNADHRGGLVGLNLVKYAERCIFALGVRSATFHFRQENGSHRMARFLGYRSIATRVTKTHDGDSFADVPTRHQGSAHESLL
jgi:hypothetical protein